MELTLFTLISVFNALVGSGDEFSVQDSTIPVVVVDFS